MRLKSTGRPWSDLAASAERGATTVLVAVLLVPVLFGAAVLSIDVGQLMWERRQLQNGSDAAVMLAAKNCANGAPCPTGSTPQLADLASANAADNTSSITSICGNAAAKLSTPALTLCPSTNQQRISDCPPPPNSLAASVPFIELRTQTKTSTGATGVSNKIASIVTKSSSNTTVASCSRAAWGPAAPTSLTVFPVLMSYCDWKSQTGYNGTPGSAVYPPGPSDSITPYGYGIGNPWTSIAEQQVYSKNNPTTCPTWNGHSAPGGFYSVASGNCQSNSVVNDWVKGTTGNSSPCNMQDPSGTSLKGTVIYIPIFDCMTGGPTTITPTTNCNSGTGNNTYYHVAGYAAFYLTGWYFSSDSQPSIKSGAAPCSGADRCMSGWFLKDLVSAGDIATPAPGGTPNFGLNIVKPVG